MFVLAILLISSAFVLAAMAGVADALVHLACWAAGRVAAKVGAGEPPHPPAQGITA